MMKKIVDRSLQGIGIGMFFYLASLLIWQVKEQTTQQITVTVVYSAIMGLSALVYGKLPGSLLVKSLLHWLLILSLTVGLIEMNGWLSVLSSSNHILVFLGQFLVTYAVIWTVSYWLKKKQVNRINQKLQNRS